VVAGRLHDDAELAHPLADGIRHLRRRLPRLGGDDELDARIEPDPVDGPDQRVPLGQVTHPGEEVLADVARVRLQPLRLDRVEHRQADAAADGVAAGRGEEASLRRERLRDLGAGDDGAEGMAVAHRLGNRDHVRLDALLAKAPEVVAQPAVADLDLVGDADPARGPDRAVHRLEVAVGEQDAPGVAVHRLGDERRRRLGRRLEAVDDREGVADVARAALRAAVGAGVGIRRIDQPHPRGPRLERARVVGDRGGDRVRRHRPAVVGLAHRDDDLAARVRPGEAQGDVICLGAAVHEHHGVEPVGREGRQPLAEVRHRSVVEARVGVQEPGLAGDRLRHPWVRVADHGHVVHHVEIDPPGRVDEVVAPPALDLGRVGVVVRLDAREGPVAAREHPSGVDRRRGAVDAEQR
jgi:hypothetical protein